MSRQSAPPHVRSRVAFNPAPHIRVMGKSCPADSGANPRDFARAAHLMPVSRTHNVEGGSRVHHAENRPMGRTLRDPSAAESRISSSGIAERVRMQPEDVGRVAATVDPPAASPQAPARCACAPSPRACRSRELAPSERHAGAFVEHQRVAGRMNHGALDHVCSSRTFPGHECSRAPRTRCRGMLVNLRFSARCRRLTKNQTSAGYPRAARAAAAARSETR